MRKIASGFVFWVSMALMGILTVPAAALFCIACLVNRATNFLIDRIEKNGCAPTDIKT